MIEEASKHRTLTTDQVEELATTVVQEASLMLVLVEEALVTATHLLLPSVKWRLVLMELKVLEVALILQDNQSLVTSQELVKVPHQPIMVEVD